MATANMAEERGAAEWRATARRQMTNVRVRRFFLGFHVSCFGLWVSCVSVYVCVCEKARETAIER